MTCFYGSERGHDGDETGQSEWSEGVNIMAPLTTNKKLFISQTHESIYRMTVILIIYSKNIMLITCIK